MKREPEREPERIGKHMPYPHEYRESAETRRCAICGGARDEHHEPLT